MEWFPLAAWPPVVRCHIPLMAPPLSNRAKSASVAKSAENRTAASAARRAPTNAWSARVEAADREASPVRSGKRRVRRPVRTS